MLRLILRHKTHLILTFILSTLTSVVESADRWRAPLPRFDTIRRIVEQDFAANSDYDRGDIISRSQVRSIVKKLRIAGWQVRPEYGIIKLALPDTHYLTRQLRTPAGERLMTSLSDHPIAYDRLHRLGSCTEGRKLVHALLHGNADQEILQYLTAPDGGKHLVTSFSRVPQGIDFDEPTGHIYTEATLIERLSSAYAADQLRRESLEAGKL